MGLHIGGHAYPRDASYDDLLNADSNLSPLPDVKVDYDRKLYVLEPSRRPDRLIRVQKGDALTDHIKGTNGHIFTKRCKFDDKAFNVYQGCVGIITEGKIGTADVQDCVALIIQDKKVTKTALAHIDIDTKESAIQDVLNYLPQGEKEVI